MAHKKVEPVQGVNLYPGRLRGNLQAKYSKVTGQMILKRAKSICIKHFVQRQTEIVLGCVLT